MATGVRRLGSLHWLAAGLLVVALGGAGARLATYDAYAAERGTDVQAGPANAATWVVGDSVAQLGIQELDALAHGRWGIVAVPGMYVTDLPSMIRQRLAAGSPPRRVVIALGTNAIERWSASDYRSAVDMLPDSTTVVFVEPWRDPRVHGEGFMQDPRISTRYAGWMRQIADDRPRTCVAPWRAWADRHPDAFYGGHMPGVHPLPTAQPEWARLVYDTVRDCSARS